MSRVTRAHDRAFSWVALTVPLVVATLVHSWVGASWLGSALLLFLIAKLLLARRFRSRHQPPVGSGPVQHVCVVVPVHNEDPEFVVASIRSLLAQTRRPDRIHVIDDGSTDEGAGALAAERTLRDLAGDIDWELTRLESNQGKRAALVVGFKAAVDSTIFVCIDSDTVLDENAIAAGLRPFDAAGVTAVAGSVMAINWDRNMLTRLIDLRYVSAFLAERAAYSFFGAVLCCCGSLSFYRADVVRSNLADFVDQRFLGQVATFGDDRRLTNYALRSGRVVLCEEARAFTAVPERFGHYLRQQVRWNKSFIRESVWVLGTFPLLSPAFLLTLAEVSAWFLIGTLMTLTFIALPLIGHAQTTITLLALVAAIAYARNAAYLEDMHRGMAPIRRLRVFAMAPLYGFLHLVVLVPLRFWALATLRRANWGTRANVEVRFAGSTPRKGIHARAPARYEGKHFAPRASGDAALRAG